MKKIKVLQVIGGLNMGGAETFLINILRNINKEKYEFVFLCYGNERFAYEEIVKENNSRILRISSLKEVGYLKFFKNLYDVIKQEQPNIIHAHTLLNSCFAVLAGRLLKIEKIIVHSHSTNSNSTDNTIFRKIYNILSKFVINIFSTNKVACGVDAARYLYYTQKNVFIIKNGVESSKFKYNEKERKRLRDILGINYEETVILHVGRFCEAKNHEFLIEVFEEYIKLDSSAKLILIGKGELKEKINKKIKEKNLEHSVIIIGPQEDVYNYYSMADCVVFPSLYEGIPLVLIEAQINGINILASDHVDKYTKFTESLTFLSLDKTANDWAKEIVKVKCRMKENIIKNNPYDISNTVKQLEELYCG